MTRAQMNMDMAELQKIQTDPGTQFSDGQDTKFVSNTQSEKAKFNKMLQARIQGSSLLKSFQDSRTPMEKMKIWKFGNVFFQKNWKYFCDIFALDLC